jgi:hypothetical protein
MIATVETCIVCTFVHRDDIHGVRQSKFHIHWLPIEGELVLTLPRSAQYANLVYHATICASCVAAFAAACGCTDTDALYMGDPMAFFVHCRVRTPKKYRAPGCTYNAGMSAATYPSPEFGYLLEALDAAYAASARSFAELFFEEEETWSNG